MSLALLILLAANLSDHTKLPYKEILKTNMSDSQNIYKGEEFGIAMYNIRTTTDKHRKGMIWELSSKKQNGTHKEWKQQESERISSVTLELRECPIAK